MVGILSRNPDLARKLNRMTGRRIPALKTASRRGTLNRGMPWLMGAGMLALLGVGLGWVARRFGRPGMMTRTNGSGILVEERGFTISEKYPAGAAAESMSSSGRAARRR